MSCFTQHLARYTYTLHCTLPYLTEDATKKLVIAFVVSKLDCNNALLYKMSKFLLDKLQLVQNNAARLTVRKEKHEPFEGTRKALATNRISD